MTLEQELSLFYKRNGFGDIPGSRPLTVSVYTGCTLVPMPNIGEAEEACRSVLIRVTHPTTQ
jgi:hypothetical protein